MIERNWADTGLRAALGSSPPLEKMKMGQKKPTPEQRAIHAVNCHDELVGALELGVKLETSDLVGPAFRSACQSWLKIANAALAKARVQR